jgi:hypothetical protein
MRVGRDAEGTGARRVQTSVQTSNLAPTRARAGQPGVRTLAHAKRGTSVQLDEGFS